MNAIARTAAARTPASSRSSLTATTSPAPSPWSASAATRTAKGATATARISITSRRRRAATTRRRWGRSFSPVWKWRGSCNSFHFRGQPIEPPLPRSGIVRDDQRAPRHRPDRIAAYLLLAIDDVNRAVGDRLHDARVDRIATPGTRAGRTQHAIENAGGGSERRRPRRRRGELHHPVVG